MKQDELISKIAAETNVSKTDVNRVLSGFANVAQDTLKSGGELTLQGVVKLSVGKRSARTGRNPRTGEAVQIAAKSVPKFSALKALKDAVA